MKVALLLLGGAALTGILAVGSVALRGEAASTPGGDRGRFVGSEPPARITMPSFALRDERGRLVRSSALQGKVTVLTFLDSQCTESCPVIAGQIGSAIGMLTPRERRSVAAIAISTDPAGDTPKSVRTFLRRHRANGRLHYLVAPESTLRPLWRRFQILSSLESGNDSLHSAPVRIYSRAGVWLATLHAGADLTEANLVRDLRTALAVTAT